MSILPSGSVNRSPLSVNASQLFNNWSAAKVSPTEQPGGNDSSSLSSLALSSSSTWAYNPSNTSLINSFGSEKGNGNSVPASKTWSSFGENNDSLWSAAGPGTSVTGSGSATKPRGPPPPGLSGQQVTNDGSDGNAASVNLMCLLNNLLVGSGPSDNQE